MPDTLTAREALIVRLIAQGYRRDMIAHLVGISEAATRAIVRDLCERYDCAMVYLPAAVNGGRTPEGGAQNG